MGPLAGIKIADMTSMLMGPFATQILGDYDGDVIKLEARNHAKSEIAALLHNQIVGRTADGSEER